MAVEQFEFSAQDSAFLECHYYQGGLKRRSFHHGANRPGWAPPQDWVGFRNECQLKKQDRLIEFVRFDFKGATVSWIAVYRFSLDAEYGDRENYSGIGLWFVNGLLTSPRQLLESLQGFGDCVDRLEFDAIAGDAIGFLTEEFVGSYIDQNVQFPACISGLPLAKNGAASTLVKEFAATDRMIDTIAGNEILSAQFLRPSDSYYSRLLLRVAGSKGGKRSESGDEEAALNFADELARLIPRAFVASGEERLAFGREREDFERSISRLRREVSDLSDEKSELARKLELTESKVIALEGALSDSSEHQRFVELYNAINATGERVHNTMSAKLADIRRDVSDLSKKCASIEDSVRAIGVGCETRIARGSEYRRSKRSFRLPIGLNDLFLYVVLTVGVIGLVVVIIWELSV